jgi:hypothetical protein
MNDEMLIDFLRGTGPDARGRYHSDILKFSDEELENTHDYIQWLFPLCEPSGCWADAPCVRDETVIAVLRMDSRVQDGMIDALARMEQFYRNNDFWLRQGDHNHLRITRILKSVSIFNTKENAEEFYGFITRRVESAMPVTQESLRYWKESMV